MLPLTLLLVAAMVVEPAQEWEGPGRLCGPLSSIELEPGETAMPLSMGAHQGNVLIRTRHGDLDYAELDSRLARENRGPGVPLASGLVAYRGGDSSRTIYHLLEGGQIRLVLSGTALDGSERDRAILDRIGARPSDRSLCTHSYRYGW